MTNKQMTDVLHRLDVLQSYINRLEQKSDKAFEAGNTAKADHLDQMMFEKCILRNGMIDCMGILGFRIEPEVGTGKWMCNIHDVLKLTDDEEVQ